MTALLSVVIPVYNAELFLPQTIQSVLDQTHQNVEIILVIDAKSTDKSLSQALSSSQRDPRIKVIQDPLALGAAANRNIGIDHASGQWLAFLDADDLWAPLKSEKQIALMSEQNSPISFTGFWRLSADGRNQSLPVKIKSRVTYQDLLKLNSIGAHTVMIDRKWLGARRFPNTIHEDFAFWLNLTRDGTTVLGINEPLASYRRVPGSRAHNKMRAAVWRWKILRNFEHLSLPLSIFYFSQYAIRALLLHLRTKVSNSQRPVSEIHSNQARTDSSSPIR